MYQFKILNKEQFDGIIPLVFQLNEEKIEIQTLKERFADMKIQNYECAVAIHKDEIIGVCGIWYMTRHYIGKSAELDHVFIKPEHRGNGLGKSFMQWVTNYLRDKKILGLELNTYVQNYGSHKFYYNEGFQIKGYHFLKAL